MTKKRYSNDFWTLEDALGIARTGDQVAQLALEVPTPFTIGVIGKWGAGKTSIARFPLKRIKKNFMTMRD